MSKKKIEEAAGAAAEVKNESPVQEESKRAFIRITTTEGKTLDNVRVFMDSKDVAKVTASYGKLNPDGKNNEEKRKNMSGLMSRPLTAEQTAEFKRLGGIYSKDALDYVARAAFPMHVDDAKYHEKNTVINDRPVNYIVIEKLDEKNLKDDQKHLAGEMQISFGIKGDKESRFYGLLNDEEKAMLRHRSEVHLDKDGKIKSLGAPLTLAAIAGRVEQRVMTHRQARTEKVNAAKAVKWDNFKLPEGAKVDKLRWSPSKEPDRIRLSGIVNGLEVSALLSRNESTAVREGMATMEQAAAANREFSSKVKGILGIATAAAVTEDAAVKAIVDRVGDKTAKSFTPEQYKTLNEFAADAETPEARKEVFDGLMAKAAPQLEGMNPKWIQDAQSELDDLAEGAERSQSQGMSR